MYYSEMELTYHDGSIDRYVAGEDGIQSIEMNSTHVIIGCRGDFKLEIARVHIHAFSYVSCDEYTHTCVHTQTEVIVDE